MTSFAAFFGAGVEYGEGVQRKKDALICESTGNVTGHGEFYAKRIREQGK